MMTSGDKPLMSSPPARHEVYHLHEQLLAEQKISAKLQGEWLPHTYESGYFTY